MVLIGWLDAGTMDQAAGAIDLNVGFHAKLKFSAFAGRVCLGIRCSVLVLGGAGGSNNCAVMLEPTYQLSSKIKSP